MNLTKENKLTETTTKDKTIWKAKLPNPEIIRFVLRQSNKTRN